MIGYLGLDTIFKYITDFIPLEYITGFNRFPNKKLRDSFGFWLLFCYLSLFKRCVGKLLSRYSSMAELIGELKAMHVRLG